ncbi:MAG: FAD-dependent oxidoreductase [Anaerolineae bacterium]|nr:FAD-dependent oxidoreductase [Anaerolineae bacterium]
MANKPIILTVDDDPAVLGAIARDLRQRYGEHYRIIRADSAESALGTLRELKGRNEVVALFLVDQRMPQMDGIGFLQEAIPFYPGAKRALLTAYADTEAAIHAINTVAIHHYLLKPWDPPTEKLYPVLDDLLDDWQADYRPAFSGIRLIGHRWSAEAHTLKDFMARNHIPYQYLDVESNPAAPLLLEQIGMLNARLPLVIYADGEMMEAPEPLALASKVGLQTRPLQQFYDVAIVGGGPAGLAAAVYAASEGLRTVMIEREAPGGQAGTSSRIENYLGFPSGISGGELARRAVDQAKRFGVEILAPQEAQKLDVDGPYRFITLGDGVQIASHALIVAVGLEYSQLDIPGIDSLYGKGVYYGASLTEALSCKDQTVVIVGAGNSAGQAAVYLAQTSARVIILVRGDSLGAKMSHYLVERIERTPNIEVRLNSVPTEVFGRDHLETVTICHVPDSRQDVVEAAGLFVFIGARPGTDWLANHVQRDRHGFIPTGPSLIENGKPPRAWPLERAPFLLEASVPGVFVVGDARSNSVKRVASAVGEGSIAVQFVHQYLAEVR